MKINNNKNNLISELSNNYNSSPDIPLLNLNEQHLIPDDLLKIIPNKLHEVVTLFPNREEKSVALLSALPLVASILRKVKVKHGRSEMTPDLYVSVIAPSGSGKSAANKMKTIVSGVDDFISNEQITTNDRKRGLFVSANTSKRALFDQLSLNSGRGLMFDTEIDPLVNASKQDWGNFTDIMRKANEHQTISISRKKEGYMKVKNPKLSICLTGTPGQFKRLFTSSEDGNFSRFAHFAYSAPPQWKSSNPKHNNADALNTACQKLSDYLLELHKLFKEGDSVACFELTDKQWEVIDYILQLQQQRAVDGLYYREIIPSVKRASLLTVRIATILAILDHPNLLTYRKPSITDEHIKAGLWISQICLASANYLLKFLPGSESFRTKSSHYKVFLDKLPKKFQRKEAVKIGESIGIANRTVDEYLSCLRKEGFLVKTAYGKYKKRNSF